MLYQIDVHLGNVVHVKCLPVHHAVDLAIAQNDTLRLQCSSSSFGPAVVVLAIRLGRSTHDKGGVRAVQKGNLIAFVCVGSDHPTIASFSNSEVT